MQNWVNIRLPRFVYFVPGKCPTSSFMVCRIFATVLSQVEITGYSSADMHKCVEHYVVCALLSDYSILSISRPSDNSNYAHSWLWHEVN